MLYDLWSQRRGENRVSVCWLFRWRAVIPNGGIEQWFERGGEGRRLETAMPPNDLRAFEAALRSSAAPAEQRLQALAILGRFAENAMLHNTPDGEEK
jgi:hypothetical protein